MTFDRDISPMQTHPTRRSRPQPWPAGALAWVPALLLVLLAAPAVATVITFDDFVPNGSPRYAYDDNGDGKPDVVFTGRGPLGRVGPGPDQLYVSEPGLEGGDFDIDPNADPTTLRIDFPFGARDRLAFGFALTYYDPRFPAVQVDVFDAGGRIVGRGVEYADFTSGPGFDESAFPEGLFSVRLSGVGAYALLAFSGFPEDRFIIDNVTTTLGTSTVPAPGLPEPGTLALALAAAAGAAGRRLALASARRAAP